MPDIVTPDQVASRRLYCLIEGEFIVFSVNAGLNCEVIDLKKKIKEEAVHGTLKDVDSYTLELWKPKDSNPIATGPADTLSERIGSQGGLSKFADKFFNAASVSPQKHRHNRAGPSHRKRDDPTDVARKLFDLWTTPVELDFKLLKGYLEEPLHPDWKIPLSHFEWKRLLQGELLPDHACCDQDLELLFNQCEDETADRILDELKVTIIKGPRDPGGAEDSLRGFWDANIRNILVQCLNARSVRNGNHGTESGQLRPNFGLLLDKVCVFRGEEKREFYTGKHPKDELKNKTRWVYVPAPYVLGWYSFVLEQVFSDLLFLGLGYYAIGVSVTLVAILPQEDGCLRVVDLITTDLSSRRERIKNASRMIKVCGILRWLQQVIGEGKDKDMFLEIRAGGKSIEYFVRHVRKAYGLEGEVDGKERVEHLQAIYASLVSKGVPNVDQLKKAEILHHGSYVDLGPVGISEGPKSPSDVRNAVVCVLEALKIAHAHPSLFHRDIRWPNIMQSREDSSKWFLIDWEDASFAPTKAALHLNHTEHSPRVYEDNHGAEVDIWAVGRLILSAQLRTPEPALVGLGLKMMDGQVLNAEQGLKEICDLPPF
ncbi:hypothetical protein F5887DRAFT_1073184 [Amanita rubescens]|nr:hypothetical protein F5887DRAFT_1073184 [Amanita rubescens]